MNLDGIKEKKILKYKETHFLLSDCCESSNITSKTFMLNSGSEYMLISRKYYFSDLEMLIQDNSIEEQNIYNIILSICSIIMMLNDYNVIIDYLKSSNVIYENNDDVFGNIKFCDLLLSLLRKKNEMRLYDLCFISPEELNGLELNEKSVIWSIGCILYEIIFKQLPFCESDNINKTRYNILKCKYNKEIIKDSFMKEILENIFKVNCEERLSSNELSKTVLKQSEIPRDNEDSLMIVKERKDMLFCNDSIIVMLPIVYPPEYYHESEKWKDIRESVLKSYNNQYNERALIILLMIKLFRNDYFIKDRLRQHIHHICKRNKECYLDKMMFNIETLVNKKDVIKVDGRCLCLCEEGMNYFFRILKLLDPIELKFYDINTPINIQSLFAEYFCQLSNIEELDLSNLHFALDFVESFVNSIQLLNKLKYADLRFNPVGNNGFKLLLPYLRLLINKENQLNLSGMNLNDESMVLLSSELCKYPNIEKIDIQHNNNIHSIGLKSLFSKFPISKVYFDFNGSKELLVDKDIPELIKYIKNWRNELNLCKLELDDNIFVKFISLRLNELDIKELYLRDNRLSHKSVRELSNSLSSLSTLEVLELSGNCIGDLGIKILSPHFNIIYDCITLNCSNMGLTSSGIKHLVEGLKTLNRRIRLLDLSYNNIDSKGIEDIINYSKENHIINKLKIHDNPIGCDGFKLLVEHLEILSCYNNDDRCFEMLLGNTSIDDECMILLADKIESIKECDIIDISFNSFSYNGLKSLCEKSLEKTYNPFIKVRSFSRKCEDIDDAIVECYVDYYVKERKDDYEHNLSNKLLSSIKSIHFREIDLSNNRITSKGLKELIDYIPTYSDRYISICNNEIGDEGVEIICNNIDKFILKRSDDNLFLLSLKYIGMSRKGFKLLIKRLCSCKLLTKINLEGYILDESDLNLMEENREIFENINELSITLKENMNAGELSFFFNILRSIATIRISGISKDEKNTISQEFCNVK